MDVAEYNRLKAEYESKLSQKKAQILQNNSLGDREKRQKFNMMKRLCVNCKKEGGTIFRTDQTHHRAMCGASTKCDLDIQIPRENVKDIRVNESTLQQELRQIKNQIIETNLDFMYKFADEDSTIRRGDALRESLQQKTNELVAIRKKLERNPVKLNETEESLQQAIQFKENIGPTLFVETIRPLAEQVRTLKYRYAEVEPGEDHTHVLVQKTHTMDEFFISKSDA